MRKKILITGASGFTGRHFIFLANTLGYDCVALCHTKQESVEGCSATFIADITNKKQLKEQLAIIQPDYVVHLAAISFVPHGDVADIYQANLIGTTNLIDCLIELHLPLKKVLIASSGNVYGNNVDLPINETMLPTPINDYGVSKYSMELAVKLRFDKLPIIMIRPFNYTGDGQAEHFLIPKIISSFKSKDKYIELGNLDVSRDFSDVRDVANAYIKLLESDARSDIYNVCTGKSISLLSIISILNELAGYTIAVKVNPDFVRENEIKELYGDNKKLTQIIGKYIEYEFHETLAWMYNS